MFRTDEASRPICSGARGSTASRRASCEDGSNADESLRLWACDAWGDKSAPARSYQASVPWDCLFCLATAGLCIGVLGLALVLTFNDRALAMTDALWMGVAPSLLPPALARAVQVPRRVIRQADALVFEFLLGSRLVVPLEEVLELQVIDDFGQFLRLLRKWAVFPYGKELRCFRGLPTCVAPTCVLLTSKCCWNFAFCLEDLPTFLIDNQKPLDLNARYRTGTKVLLRAGESFSSPEVCNMRRGRWLRVERQHGRRVLVRFEPEDAKAPRCDSCGRSYAKDATPVGARCVLCGQKRLADGTCVEGWMSYVSKNGYFLLVKQPTGASSVGDYGGTKTCVMGASELSRGPGRESSAVELPMLRRSAE